VKRIVSNVRKRATAHFSSYAAQFDGLKDAASVHIAAEEMAAAWEATSPALRDALSTAAEQIRGFAQRQLPGSWNESPIAGLTTGQLVRPLASVGCYVPSGRHPLPSTLLMTAIPAQVAGVQRIVVVSPKPSAGNSRRCSPARHHGVLSPRRRARHRRAWPMEPQLFRASTRSSAPAISTSPPPSAWWPSTAPSTCSPVPRNRRHQRARPRSRHRFRPGCASRTRSRGPRHLHHHAADLAKEVVAETKLGAAATTLSRAKALDRNGLVIIASTLTKRTDHQSPRPRAPHRRCAQRSRLGSECRLGLHRPLVRAAHGRLHLRAQSHLAHRRHGARARRPQRQRLRQAHHGAAIHRAGHALTRTARRSAGRSRRPAPATQKPFVCDSEEVP
jgi:hypothetical protein